VTLRESKVPLEEEKSAYGEAKRRLKMDDEHNMSRQS
jgi:hypothetical protein